MKTEKILTKKIKELDKWKSLLVSRSDNSKEEIVEEIKETIEDIELILEDFKYIESKDEEIVEYRTYNSFKEMESKLE
ncbi:MAG: hypothetical protein GX275_07770 [Clostridiales bacterium]|nr:hypothetical protein [Clostridiales bacterium]